MSDDEVGSVAEEAAKLLAALQDWARDSGARATADAWGESFSDRLRDIGEHVGHGPDCRYCPVCLAINVVRDTSPEAREKVAAAAVTLVTAAAEALGDLFAPSAEEPVAERQQRDDAADGREES